MAWGTRHLVATVGLAGLLVSSCASHHSLTVKTTNTTSNVADPSPARTVQIDTTWKSTDGSPQQTTRRVYDFARHVGEVFPSSNPDGSVSGEIILDGATQYQEDLAADYPGVDLHGKKWETVAAPPESASVERLFYPFDSPLPLGPMAALAKLAPAVTSVRKAGSTTIGGVTVGEYALTLSSEQLESYFSDGYNGVADYDPSVHFSEIVYIDDQGRYRRTQLTISDPTSGGETITNDYSNFGIAVDVTDPPASQVASSAEMHQLECSAVASGNSPATDPMSQVLSGCKAPPAR